MFSLGSSLASEPDRAKPLRLQQNNGRRCRADSGEPPKTALPRPILVPENHRRCLGVHSVRPQSTRGAHPGQVCPHNGHRGRLHLHHALPILPLPAVVLAAEGLRPPAPVRHEEPAGSFASW